MTRSNCSSLMSLSCASITTPALFTRASMRPQRTTTESTMRSTLARSVTSTSKPAASPPCSWISATVSLTPAGSRSHGATFAPSRAKRSAAAWPMPRPAPVMIATLLLGLIAEHSRKRRPKRRQIYRKPLFGTTRRQPPPLLARRGGGRRPTGWSSVELLPDCFQHALKIPHHVLVLEPQHSDAKLRQVPVAPSVADLLALGIMRGAVQLHRQLLPRAIEIENVHAHAMLATKLASTKLRTLQCFPQHRLRRSEVRPELRATALQALEVIESHEATSRTSNHPAGFAGTPPWKGGETYP